MDSTAATSLTLDISDSVTAVRDLRIRALHSQISGKSELISKLDEFVEGAEETGVSLADMSVLVGGTAEK